VRAQSTAWKGKLPTVCVKNAAEKGRVGGRGANKNGASAPIKKYQDLDRGLV